MGYTVFMYGCTALFLAAMLPLMGGFAAPAGALPSIGALVVICTLGGHALFTYALGFVRADVISFALLGEPIGAAIWALLLFNESVSWQMALGGGLAVAGLALYLRGTMRARENSQPESSPGPDGAAL
jgi:drug/metabolite transporter (DMT)-like permease